MDLVQESDEKYLAYETDEYEQWGTDSKVWFWNDRLALVQYDVNAQDEFYRFIAFDLLTKELQPLRFHKFDQAHRIFQVVPLGKNFGVIVEQLLEESHHVVSLVKIDWTLHELVVIEQFEKRNRIVFVFERQLKPYEFVVGCYDYEENSCQFCKLKKGKIEFGETHQLDTPLYHCSDNEMIGHGNIFENQLDVYDIVSKKEESVDIEELPDGAQINENYRVKFLEGRLYCSLFFEASDVYGIAWTSAQTKRWNLLNFETDLRMNYFIPFNGCLAVFAQDEDDDKHSKFYRMPLRRPQSLRNSAWLAVVRMLEENGDEAPYITGKMYLPLNTDVRSVWFEDDGEENKSNNALVLKKKYGKAKLHQSGSIWSRITRETVVKALQLGAISISSFIVIFFGVKFINSNK